ncbi:SBBP repeat-containing protein [Bacillus sp. NTK034]|uniref:DUF7948 domain-containing protein n=1 Tax=Bacillus sp. NTK034 TaxID=2802176 RepID=UPI001A8CE519|nr:SBBP repeat-containing protein [Bacillus sp. NTK034]MBN8201461.1 SBBP repeat-containing protein [Bacillus sp. NTK034]
MKGASHGAFFTSEKVIYTFFENGIQKGEDLPSSDLGVTESPEIEKEIQGICLDFRFLFANKGVTPIGRGKMQGKVNYFKGNDPAKWHTNIPLFQEIVYSDLWPGIDLVFRGEKGQIKYEFWVQPGANVEDIRFTYDGAIKLSLNEKGNLLIDTAFGQVIDECPVSVQEKNNKQVSVQSSFKLETDDQDEFVIGFKMGEEYDIHYPLIIDPGIIYSSYLGGAGQDRGVSIDVDDSGNAYVTGFTFSPTGFPFNVNAFQPTFGGANDAFITKVDPDGILVYSSYLGGNGSENGLSIASDNAGNAYVTGFTSSPTGTFPTLNAFQPAFGGGGTFGDAFITKVDPDGMIVYSSYLGGTGSDRGSSIAVDQNGNAYVTGQTASPTGTFPIMNAFQPTFGGGFTGDAFVTKVGPAGSLIYSSYLGGTGADEGNSIAADDSGNAYITGATTSPTGTFPTINAFQPAFGGVADAFVTKVNPTGGVIYSSYLGGSGNDQSPCIAVDTTGNAYVTGFTSSPTGFPFNVNAFQPIFGGVLDAFITRVDPNGMLIYSSYLGGTDNDRGNKIAVDSTGNAYVTGLTQSSTGFPTMNAFQPQYGGGFADAFISKVNPAGMLIYSSYLGGTGNDQASSVAVDSYGYAYVTGGTSSPTGYPFNVNAFQATYGGGQFDAFVSKVDPLGLLIYSSYLGGSGIDSGIDISVDALGNAYVTGSTRSPDVIPFYIAIGDFNGDDILDLAVTNSDSDNVSILLGEGDGTFQAPVYFAAGDFPIGITTGDFNNNGSLDLAVTNLLSNTVSILVGNGNGTFQAAMNFGVGNGPFGITTGDFDGNGILDLAVTNSGSPNVSILLGNGNGTFQPAMNFGAGNEPYNITTGDFNGNGILDLAVANRSSDNVSILMGNGDGTFQAAMNIGGFAGPTGIVTGDFNNNGILDLAVTNQFTDNVSILMGNGDGTFQAAIDFGAGSVPTGIVKGDFNNNGTLDLAVTNQGSNDISILMGNGDGTFQAAMNFAVGQSPEGISSGDFNGNGILDLAVVNMGSSSVSILLGNGDGTFQAAADFFVGNLFPTLNAFQPTFGGGGEDAFVTKIGLICPSDITVENDPGQCGAIVNYSLSPGAVCTPPSGSFFPVGEADVTCTEASQECSFIITVNETEPPSIVCPADITVINDSGRNGAFVNFPEPSVSDNCPGVTAVCTPASGSFFPPGTTTVTCIATDAAGNTSTCSFNVKVVVDPCRFLSGRNGRR